MLNKIQIHKTAKGTLWFKSADCAHVLKVRSDSFLRGKVTKKLGNKGFRHIDEKTFREAFKLCAEILDQLDHYKLTGEILAIEVPVLTQQSLQSNKGFVYVFEDTITKQYKIGVTARDITEMLRELNQSPGASVIVKYISPATNNFTEVENKLHYHFKHKKIEVDKNPSLREWFNLSSEDYALLLAILQYEFKC